MSLTKTIKRESRAPVWDKPLPDLILCFCPNCLWFCWISLVVFGKIIFQKIVTNPLFEWEFIAVQQDKLYPQPGYEQVTFFKKSRLYINGRSLRDGKVTTYLQLAQKWNLSTKIWQNKFCINILSHFRTLSKKIKNLEFI